MYESKDGGCQSAMGEAWEPKENVNSFLYSILLKLQTFFISFFILNFFNHVRRKQLKYTRQ